MDLARDVVQNGFARSIGTHRERTHFHAANAAHGGAQRDELRLPSFIEKGFHGLKEEQGPIRVRLDVVLEVRERDCGEGCNTLGDTCIRNDDVEVGDFLLFQKLGKVGGVGLILGVIFGDGEFAVRAFRETREGFGSLIGWVTDCGDDGDGGAGEEGAEESSAKTSRDFSKSTWTGRVEGRRSGRVHYPCWRQ